MSPGLCAQGLQGSLEGWRSAQVARRGEAAVRGAEGARRERGAGRGSRGCWQGPRGSPEDAAQHILHMSSEEEEV